MSTLSILLSFFYGYSNCKKKDYFLLTFTILYKLNTSISHICWWIILRILKITYFNRIALNRIENFRNSYPKDRCYMHFKWWSHILFKILNILSTLDYFWSSDCQFCFHFQSKNTKTKTFWLSKVNPIKSEKEKNTVIIEFHWKTRGVVDVPVWFRV